MTTSAKIQEIVLKYLADEQTHSIREIKQHLSGQGISDYTEGQFSGSINTLLRNQSITKVDRGVYSLKTRSENMRKCFVVSPIGDEGSEIRKNADQLFKYIINPACQACDFEPVRVDLLNDAGSITQSIIDYLEDSDLVIADISGHNPNVFYEIGYRTRTKKPIIHLKSKSATLPFDINTIRTFDYDLTDLDSVESAKSRLTNTIKSFSYPSPEELTDNDIADNLMSAPDIMPILYQILDGIADLKNEVRNVNAETIGTVIKSMQNSQPQMSADVVLQTQLLQAVMQNPDNFLKIAQLAEKLPGSKGK